jgi:hypothetical protein
VDWASEGLLDAVPARAREMKVEADRLREGGRIRLRKIKNGFGASLLQAFSLLVRGEEASGLQRSKRNIYVQKDSKSFSRFSRLAEAARAIAAAA